MQPEIDPFRERTIGLFAEEQRIRADIAKTGRNIKTAWTEMTRSRTISERIRDYWANKIGVWRDG
jgi:hypothetical protein